MNKLFYIYIILLICVLSINANAQQSTIVLKAQASQGGSSIKMRWVLRGDTLTANSANGDYFVNVWNRFIKNGYIIERRRAGSSTIERIITTRPDIDKLQDGSVNFPIEQERLVCTSMKKVLFGDKNVLFTKPENVSSEEEINQRIFGLTILSALSFKASCYAGLAFVDENVVPNITYEYTIKEANPPAVGNYSATVTIENTLLILQNSANIQKAKQSRTASGQRIAAVLQAPPAPKAKFGNKKVELRWPWRKLNALNSHQDLYYGYFIERATYPTDTTFKRLNKMPFIATNLDSDTLSYTDQDTTKANTELKNGKKYKYRLVGKTYFDEEIVATNTVSGTCEDDSPFLPFIVKDTLINSVNQVQLTWNYPQDAPLNHFKSFQIGRTEELTKNTVFQRIPTIGGQLTLDSTIRAATVNHNVSAGNSTKSAYYVIIGKTKTGQEFTSFPSFVQGIDTLAPAPPLNVIAVWNESSKTATITWNANMESDLLGYKIYRCIPGGTPIAISDTAINKTTTYTDSVKIDNLKILYHITAIDRQFNQSAFSIPAILRIPDKAPPVKPSFGNYKINKKGQVELIIYASPSSDVASHILRRKIDSLTTTLKTWTSPGKPDAYKDSTLTNGGTVTYIIEAKDSTGNMSGDTLVINVPTVLIAKPQFTILNSNASRIDPSIKLSWEYSVLSSLNDVLEFVVLKSDVSVDPTGKLGTWKTASGDAREIIDYDVIYERSYKYGVKAVFKDGSVSQWLYATLTMPTICGAAKYLEERGKIEPASSVLKEACASIRLLPGFHAKKNSVFHAVIKPK
jgi:uncharacterized protein